MSTLVIAAGFLAVLFLGGLPLGFLASFSAVFASFSALLVIIFQWLPKESHSKKGAFS